MAPTLSPKKTWEGLIGGLILSAAAAVAIHHLTLLHGGYWNAAAFGLVVGGVGALGDLAESMIKRDCRRKDASQVMPGFGGVLDVVDSLLTAAPVAYLWLRVRATGQNRAATVRERLSDRSLTVAARTDNELVLQE